MPELLEDIIEAGQLPTGAEGVLPFITEAGGSFVSREGPLWDFKESWPQSYSDSYFHGLCRLICAFANTNGGLVVFGVSDKQRTGGWNKIHPDLDRFAQAFKNLVGESLQCDFRRYDDARTGKFEVLLVRPLARDIMPLRFRALSKHYPSDVIWVRQGHEVVGAEPRHIAQIYCRLAKIGDQEFIDVDGTLPPSPATIRQFVGRMQTIDRIFEWLKLSDQPRNFLFGKGGSGKSTIAFQITKVLRDSGAGFLFEGQDALEKVMFLTGKERELNVSSLSQKGVIYTDFKDERTLYEAILTEGGTEYDVLDELTMTQLKKEIQNLFARTSCFIVLDDIDTLTTKGLEAGFEFLIGALYKAPKRSRILYTLRNAPSQALSNSIDVPGLNDDEYAEFVELACKQFDVDPPSQSCRDDDLSTVSERRPLVIESVIALRRHTDSYDRALALFKSGGGDDVRRYVFRREWDSIKPSSHGRELLAILALYKAKITYDDLVSLMYDNAAIVPDALADVQEMFIQLERAGDKPLYRLNDLTRAFVLEAAKELDRYDSLKARVQKFVTNVYADSAELSAIVRQVERAVEAAKKGDESALRTTWASLQQAKTDSVISEDPRFMAACGYVALHLSPPNMADAREYFQNSFKMRHGPELKYVRDWFVAEQRLDGADYHTGLIYDLVNKTREYDDAVRLEFTSRRAVTLYKLASDGVWSEPEKSLSRLYESIRLHALGFQATYRDDTKQAFLFQRHFTNSTFLLKNLLMKAGKLDELIGYLADLTRLPGAKLDPLLGPIREVAASSVEVTRPTDAPRAAGRMLHLGRVLAEADCWLDRAVKD